MRLGEDEGGIKKIRTGLGIYVCTSSNFAIGGSSKMRIAWRQLMSNSRDPVGKDFIEKTVSHEENLINTRLTWMLTFQGLLFIAVGLADEGSRLAFFSVIPWIGIAVAALTFIGALAAYATIDNARKEHRAAPGFGGMGWRKWLGRANSLGIPFVIATTWGVLYFKLA